MLQGAGSADSFKIEEIAAPQVTAKHVIISVDYASVGIWDVMKRNGSWWDVVPNEPIGADGSGTIVAVGSGVEGLDIGDRVYAYSINNPGGGFYAQYVSVPADRVWHVPKQLDQKTAGAMPSVALTAQAGLEALEVKSKDVLLVFGASGGVGSLSVWLASGSLGANVVGTARAEASEYVRKLGAAHVVDPSAADLESEIMRVAPKGFETALVTANGLTLSAFLTHLRPSAKFAYPGGVNPEPSVEGHPAITVSGEMSRPAMRRLNEAIGTRTMPLHVEEFALEDVAAAHRRVEGKHVVGKVVLKIAS